MPFDVDNLSSFPSQPGVYIMKDKKGRVLYVGKARHLKNRVKNYFGARGDTRAMIPFLIAEIDEIDTIIVPSEKEALLLENTLIKKHKPKYNALLKDDKTFIGLLITTHHPWPMIRLVRYKGTLQEKGIYFGPYVSAYAARKVFDLLSRLFPLRQCSNEELKRRTRPCLLYAMQKCIAPCVGKCSKEEYALFVEGATAFLKGQNRAIVKTLEADMKAAAEQLEFEKAAALQKTITQIKEITEETQVVAKIKGQNINVIGLYREGYNVVLTELFWRGGKLMGSDHYFFNEIAEENSELLSSFILQHYRDEMDLPKEILVSLPLPDAPFLQDILRERFERSITIHCPQRQEKQKLIAIALTNAKAVFHQKGKSQEITDKTLTDLEEKLHLNRFPGRIECFDISNLAGRETVASMVAFTSGEKDKKRTRLFTIKEAKAGDDYGAMREVLTRRLMRAREEMDLPDLIIVDGGKGQLHVALEVLKELDIASVDVIGLAKEKARHDKGLSQEKVFLPFVSDPVCFSSSSPLLFFLQRIRDEAHRVAIGFHKKRRTKTVLRSALEELPGIGPKKKQRLLSHFGSIARLSKAPEEDLAKVEGLTKKDIATLLSFFKDSPSNR